MRAEERAQQSESSISIMELICSPTLRAPLIIGIVMQLSQQLSGINAVSDTMCTRKISLCCSSSWEIRHNGFLLLPLSLSHIFYQVFYYSTSLFMSSGLTEESAKFATIGIGCIMVNILCSARGDFCNNLASSLLKPDKITNRIICLLYFILFFFLHSGCNDSGIHPAYG